MEWGTFHERHLLAFQSKVLLGGFPGSAGASFTSARGKEEKDKGNPQNDKFHIFSCDAASRDHPLKNKQGWEAAERKTSKKERKRRRQ